MFTHVVCGPENIAALTKLAKSQNCKDIVSLLATQDRPNVTKVFVASDTIVAYGVIAVDDDMGFTYAAVNKVCFHNSTVEMAATALDYFENVVVAAVTTEPVEFLAVVLNTQDVGDVALYNYLTRERDYDLSVRHMVFRTPEIVCSFVQNNDPRPICKPPYILVSNVMSDISQQQEIAHKANDVRAAELTPNMHWRYQQLTDGVYLGYLALNSFSEFECSVASVFVRMFSAGCTLNVAGGFAMSCRDRKDAFLCVLLVKPKTVDPEDALDQYSLGPRFTQDDARRLLIGMDAPITRGLVGLSFLLATLKPLPVPGSNAAYIYISVLSRCTTMSDKYKPPIDPQTGRPMNVTVMLMNAAEQTIGNYGVNKSNYDAVPFSVLNSAPSAYFFYLKKAGYTQIDPQTAKLTCELFGYDTNVAGTTTIVYDETGTQVSVPHACDDGGVVLMYKPLM